MFNQVRELMKKANLEGLWVTDEKSIHYLINEHYQCNERFIGLYIDLKQKPKLVLNRLFMNESNEVDLISYFDHDDVHQIIQDITTGKRIGLDKNMRAEFVLSLLELDAHFENGSHCVDQLRAIKDEIDINMMINASSLNDQIMNQIRDYLKVGVSEIDVKNKILQLFSEQSVKPSFEVIVAFGDHGCDPHAIPSDRRLTENESIIIDIGCVVNGYCSDMTRTYFLETNPIKEIYSLVLEANKKAIEAIKPGVTFSELDKVARDVITKGGYGDYFIHRLGHGIGKEVHEPYDVSASNNQQIQPGMCFSIEPGIYKPGVDAVRIEDLVYVNQQGYGVVMNHVDKENPIIQQ